VTRPFATRRNLVAAIAAAAVATALAPAAAHARTNCCFELSADSAESAMVDYGNDPSNLLNGTYEAERFWSIRSIVAFHETAVRHRPSLRDEATEARLLTAESEHLTKKTARKDPSGNPVRDPEKCKDGSDGFQGGDSQPAPLRGGVSLPHESSGYRLKLDPGALFDAQSLQCPGGADFGLHRKLGADVAKIEVTPPKRAFLRVASAGDHKSRTFSYGPVSVTHGNVAGPHTYTGQGKLTLRFKWFPKADLAAERKRLRKLECDPDIQCEKDRWGR
jgi:hypothetical protein